MSISKHGKNVFRTIVLVLIERFMLESFYGVRPLLKLLEFFACTLMLPANFSISY